MANHNIKEPKEYTEGIRKFEPTDRGHADVFNDVIDPLVNNDAYTKEKLEKIEAPEYTASGTLEELSSGESIFKAFGKIKKAVGTLISHIQALATASDAGHMSAADKIKLDSMAANATNSPILDSIAVTDYGKYALDAVQANASIPDTLGNKISILNANVQIQALSKQLSAGFDTSFRTQTKGDASSGNYISTVRTDEGGVNGAPTYSTGLAWGRADTQGYLCANYGGAEVWVGAGNGDKLNWMKRLAFAEDVKTEIDTLKYIVQAESVGWKAGKIESGYWPDFAGVLIYSSGIPKEQMAEGELYVVKFNDGRMQLVRGSAKPGRYGLYFKCYLIGSDIGLGPNAPHINDTIGAQSWETGRNAAYVSGESAPIAMSTNANVKAWYARINNQLVQ